jgi:hypothetical protein
MQVPQVHLALAHKDEVLGQWMKSLQGRFDGQCCFFFNPEDVSLDALGDLPHGIGEVGDYLVAGRDVVGGRRRGGHQQDGVKDGPGCQFAKRSFEDCKGDAAQALSQVLLNLFLQLLFGTELLYCNVAS